MRFELGTVPAEQVLAFYQTSTRLDRAVHILDNVVRDAPGICLVQSQTNRKIRYVVDTYAGTCTCPDFTQRMMHQNLPCKHLMAARLKEKIEQ